MRCYLYPDEIGAAELIANVFDNMAKVATVEFEAVRARSVAVVRTAPVLFVGSAYRVHRNGKWLRGEIRVAVHPHPTRPALCMHDEPGRAESFERSANRLFASPAQAETPAPVSVQVRRMASGNVPVGFERLVIVRGADGSRTITSTRALLAPQGGGSFVAEDAISTMTVDADGVVMRGTWIKASRSEIKYVLRLTRDEGVYRYSGERQGKPTSGELHTKGAAPLQNDDFVLEGLGRQRWQRAFELETEQYVPSAEPTRSLTVRYARSQGDPENQFSFTMPGLSGTVRLDRVGLARLTTVKDGREVVIERLDDESGR